MVTKNKISAFLNQKWPPFLVLIAMVLSSVYLYFYIRTGLQIGYVWEAENFEYWFIFPYSDTYFVAILAGFLFLLCGFIFTFMLNKPNQTVIKKFITVIWSIFSVLGLITLCGFIFLLSWGSNVDHLGSVAHDESVYHLAYKNNNEAGFTYYLFECNRFTFQCKKRAHFFPYKVVHSDDDARLAQLNITSDGILTVTYKDQEVYKYPIPPK